MKTGKRIISLLLSAIMVLSVFAGVGDFSSLFNFEASAADITLGGITQTRVVSNYESLYKSYQERFFTGRDSNSPTNFVIPGLSSKDDYTPQGMTYWQAKEWILISAYDASGSGKHSVIYALDAATTEFVALFRILNADGSVNTSHGGGIAASEYNFYYADTASKISYIPLSDMDVAPGTVKDVRLKDSINCAGELNNASTSYCCYDDGVLWAGNFYFDSDDYDYDQPAHSNYNSLVVGYKLQGNSSDEEWYYLSEGYNLIKLNNDSTADQTASAGGSTMTYKTFNVDGANAEIRGSITYGGTPVGEICPSFASFTLTEGKKYKIEFISTNNLSDIYMFAPNGGHTNVKQSQQTTITPLANGKYHYQMIFTAGLRPTGADSLWPTTQSTNGTYTGTYTMRFDQDNITGNRDFAMTDISITEYVEPNGFTPDSQYEGVGCAGNPTYVIALNNDLDKVQYAMVDKGNIYISRSWSRTESSNHIRELVVGEMDINAPGTVNLSINGRTRPCHVVDGNNVTKFGGSSSGGNRSQMLYMGEALCVMDDYLYMFGESAAWHYNGKDSGSKCPEPIDVIWKIDQHSIMDEPRAAEEVAVSHYQKVNSLSEINNNDEYIIVFESTLKDPVTQKNIIYALDAFGGYGSNKLPKQDAGTQANTGDSMGIVGYKITTYTKDDATGELYISEEDDANRSIRWRIRGAGTSSLRIDNTDLYYSKYMHLYFGSRLIAMTTDSRTNLDNIKIDEVGNGNFYFRYEGNASYYLWCNDGRYQNYIDAYTNYYSNHGKSGYVPAYHGLEEVPGTFHSDGLYQHTANNTGNMVGAAIDTKLGEMQIYKRVPDQYSSVYDTRVFTDLNAELQADGTYKIDLETYAISPTQYQKVDERPTDFIFVLDSSGSMSTQDCNGYHRHNSFDLEAAAGNSDVSGHTSNSSNSGTVATYTGNMWIQHTDGELCQVSVKVQGDGRTYKFPSYHYHQRVYLWYTHPDTGVKYWYHPGSGTWTTTETTYNEAQQVSGSGQGDRRNTNVFYGVCYEKRSDSSRLSNLQIAVNQLTWKIQEKAQSSGLDHRIAVVQYGSNSNGSWTNTGMYTNDSTARVAYTGAGTVSGDAYRKAFHSVSQFGNVRNIIDNMTASGDTFVDYGLDMAYNIVTHAEGADGTSYLADGNRSACIIMITDGCPGFGGSDSATANTVANAAITNAYNAKNKGAYVYTVQMGNNSMSGFDMDGYMDYVSSEFIYAKSMSDSGERNIREIDYRIDVPISGFSLDGLVNSIFDSVTSNSTNALAKLDADSIVREQISDAFDLSNAKVSVNYANAQYDGLDRLYFDEPYASGLTTSIGADNTILVKGYDYSTHFVAPSNLQNAKKLVVTLTDVLPNVNAELDNTSINNTTTTAIYQDQSKLNSNEEYKYFPTEMFSIPEYTYVLDFGINMLDIDVNGTLQSVDILPRKQETYSTLLNDPDNSNAIIGFSADKQNLLYSLQPGASADEAKSRGYILIQRDDGTYDWFRINVVPASNVLYEETSAFVSGSGVEWNSDGTAKNKYQALTSVNDIYGHDEAYNNNIGEFSNGSAYNAVVSSTNNRSKTLTFDYTGSAVDIISACGPQTGIQVISVKNKDGSIEKAYIIDTYYTDAQYLNGQNVLSQVPIIHHENKNGHGTYTVEVTAAYLSSMVNARPMAARSLYSDDTVNFYTSDVKDMAAEAVLSILGMEELLDADIEVLFADENSVLNGGTGAAAPAVSTFALTRAVSDRPLDSLNNYFDGFRVYNPLGDMSGDYVESEQGATYYNVINSLASSNDIVTGTGNNLVAYVEGNTNETINFADYAGSKAPLNEVYLTNNNAIGFNVEPGYQKIMVSLRAASGSPKAKIGDKEFVVPSSTEMYYDITDYVQDGAVTVQNTGNGLLAVCTIKVVNGGLMPLMMSALPRMRTMMAMPSEEVVPNQPKVEEPVINPDLSPDRPGGNPDPDLDVEGSIPDYVPETSDPDNSENMGIAELFAQFVDAIKSFFEKIMTFFRSFFA